MDACRHSDGMGGWMDGCVCVCVFTDPCDALKTVGSLLTDRENALKTVGSLFAYCDPTVFKAPARSISSDPTVFEAFVTSINTGRLVRVNQWVTQ